MHVFVPVMVSVHVHLPYISQSSVRPGAVCRGRIVIMCICLFVCVCDSLASHCMAGGVCEVQERAARGCVHQPANTHTHTHTQCTCKKARNEGQNASSTTRSCVHKHNKQLLQRSERTKMGKAGKSLYPRVT